MTRREWLIGVLGVSSLLLLSCGGDEEEEQAREEAPSDRKGTSDISEKEIRPLGLAFLDTPLAVSPAQKAIQAWNSGSIADAPVGLTLQEVRVPLAMRIRGYLTAQDAGGVPPDLVWLPLLEDIPDIFKSGLIAPVERWLQVEQKRPLEPFAEEARRLVCFRGQTMALPIAVSPGVLAHNASRFADVNIPAPTLQWTWADFIGAAQQLTEDRDGDGVIDRWGFGLAGMFLEWLPLVLQEGGMVADLDTGSIGLENPAALRALNAWDEFGRVQGIHPYGPDTKSNALFGFASFHRWGMYFTPFTQRMPEPWRMVTPMPQGDRRATPLVLTEALAIPAAAGSDHAYQALVPLAHWLGERRSLPAVQAGWQYIQKPDREHFDLVLPEPTRETALQALDDAIASHVASSPSLTQGLFNIITYRLARGEVGIEQALDEAAGWLQRYINE